MKKNNLLKAISLMLALSLLTVCVFAADNGSDRKGRPDDRQKGGSRQEQAAFAKRFSEDYLTSIKEKAAGLEDEELKAELNELIEQYSEISAEIGESVGSEQTKEQLTKLNQAEKALREALEKANISNSFEASRGKEENERSNRGKSNGIRFNLDIDTDKLTEAVNALTDEAAKAKLTELVESYKEKCAALIEKTDMDEETLKQLREEAMSISKELVDAMKEAGIEMSEYLNNSRPNDEKGEKSERSERQDKQEKTESKPERKQKDNGDAKSEEQPSSSETVAESAQQKSSSFWSKLLEWFK